MSYRTKTYIAADWDNDHDAVEKLLQWNNSNYWALNFHDVHETTQSRDTSLYCSIKSSLRNRMDISKTFVLIVGSNTNSVTKGNCSYCRNYSPYWGCSHNNSINHLSYINYECELAVKANIKIVVLYKSTQASRFLCPAAVRNIGVHVPMYKKEYGQLLWNYEGVKNALM